MIFHAVEDPMLNKKSFLFAALTALCLFLTLTAAAETARVITPGGKMNVRKAANDKSKLVVSVPNKALVEVKEVGKTWSLVTYQKKTGYAKTDYLRLPSKLPGKTVYADEGTVLLRKEAKASGAVLRPVGSQEGFKVLSVDGKWARVECGGDTGYVEVSHFSYQYAKPRGTLSWMNEPGVVQSACTLRAGTSASSAKIATLAKGDAVTATVVEEKNCLVITEKGTGYVPTSAICLTGPEDTGKKMGSIPPADACSLASAALKETYKNFAKQSLYCIADACKSANGLTGAMYRVGFFNDRDKYVYGALVNARTGAVLYQGSYTAFATPPSKIKLLPEGEVVLTLSADTLAVGEILDITVDAWTRHQTEYKLEKDGKAMKSGRASEHFAASFRPRAEGTYKLTVTVTDEKKKKVSASKTFTVKEKARESAGKNVIYSQKDGWWKDKKYRNKNLEHSGCAIFTLSHALQRMGKKGSKVQPAALAKTYALCLTPEGTNNERLITTASKHYGFTTQRVLIKDDRQIVSLLKKGCLFSFSIARSHIALVSGISADGSMIRVVDSAPGATHERIVNASLYYATNSGSFRSARTPMDIPGARWYFETEDYGGLEYYLPLSYVAKRGVRLIQPK